MIFRWTIWGEHKEKSLELLKYSILSFKKQFGEKNRYIVYTDNSSDISEGIKSISEVLQFDKDNEFNIDSIATWKKWCPRVKLDIDETEIYVDFDVFLLKYPKELDDFLNNPDFKFAIMDEYNGQSWQHGAMQKKEVNDAPFVNAGFFVQKAGHSISEDLLKEKKWWTENVLIEEQKHHDEQGALAIALSKYNNNGELFIFPKNKYMLIGPNENKDMKSLDEVILFHAVYPKHPAFYQFKDYLDKILYE